jgi:hypothetical protein
MPLVCPQCQQTYDQHSVCPLCNVVLLYHTQNLQTDSSSVHAEPATPQWQQTPWGKILIGLILAQGLSHGLRQLLTAGLLVGGDDPDVWSTLWGLVILHSIHGISLIIGGALTGAGQSRGIVFGAIVGLANGVLTLFMMGRFSEPPTSLLVYAEPLIHLATGMLGGALGMLIWKPAPKIPLLEGSSSTPVAPSRFEVGLGRLFVGPIYVGRVCAGAFVVVIGVVWANAILEFLLRASQGTLATNSHLQARLVSMEISALVALLGAAFAGASTTNGLKQGLCVRLGASAVIMGLQMSNPNFALHAFILQLSGIVMVTLVGGWLGCQLFPPILRGSKRRRGLSYYA